LIDYYEARASEYDATSWEHPGGDGGAAVRNMLDALIPAKTLDVGCGTGYVSRWLPGELTLMDASSSMLGIARHRLPSSHLVRAMAPSLPFIDGSFERAFTSNLYGHLEPTSRADLLAELMRVSAEVVILDQLSESNRFREGPERRQLQDGTRHTVHKCYFTTDRLLEEVPGAEVLMSGPVFVAVRIVGPRASSRTGPGRSRHPRQRVTSARFPRRPRSTGRS